MPCVFVYDFEFLTLVTVGVIYILVNALSVYCLISGDCWEEIESKSAVQSGLDTMASSQGKHMPKDTQIIVSIMKDLGIHEFDQQVLNHLLEFNYSNIAVK